MWTWQKVLLYLMYYVSIILPYHYRNSLVPYIAYEMAFCRNVLFTPLQILVKTAI